MHSAILPSYNSIGIHKNHMEMAKFSSEEDPGYLAVSTELWRWVRDIKIQRQLVEKHEGPSVDALNRQQIHPQWPATTNPLQPDQRARLPDTQSGISPAEAFMAQMGTEFFQSGYGGNGPVIQGGNIISGQAGSGDGKTVQGNNIRAGKDMTLNM